MWMWVTDGDTPSESELRKYFDHALSETLLDTTILNKSELLAKYGDAYGLGLVSLRQLGGDDFFRLAKESLWAVLWRMNSLPRTDPFWQNTNGRPTWFKLPYFCQAILRADQQDEQALRCLGTLEAVAGDRFGQEYWKRLHKIGTFHLSWSVCVAYWVSPYAPDAHAQLAEFLGSMQSVEESLALLSQFRTRGAGDLPEWIGSVISS